MWVSYNYMFLWCFVFYDNRILYSTMEALEACRWITLEKLVHLLKVSHCKYGLRVFYGRSGCLMDFGPSWFWASI